MPAPPAAALPPPKTGFNRRLAATLPPSAAEAAALLHLDAVSRVVRPGQEIVSEGKRCNNVFLIVDGIAIRYRILRDGQRQILNLLLPGEFAGVISCRFESALYSIKTLTQTTVAPIPLARLLALLDTDPQLAARLLWSFSSEQALVSERLIAIGRRSAAERIAHFLLELFARLQRIGLADERSYRLPLTQEMISDALGLSVPYVNRVLRQLREDGLVRIEEQRVCVDNIEELAALADFDNDYLKPLSIDDLLADRG